jgi:hypothetical protein
MFAARCGALGFVRDRLRGPPARAALWHFGANVVFHGEMVPQGSPRHELVGARGHPREFVFWVRRGIREH